LDFVLPRKERTRRTEHLSVEDVPLTPALHHLLGEDITTLMDYEDARCTDLVQSLKYDASLRAAELCAHALSEYLREEIASERLYDKHPVILIPMPLYRSRHRERGFNQIGRVLDALPEEFKNGKVSRIGVGILDRVRSTSPQTRLPRSERLSNVAGAFAVSDASFVQNSIVYLIDDVTTTGATLVNAGNALRRAGARVHLIALARA
jgi:ComF family protein